MVALLRDEPLSRHTTFHVGGRCDLLVVESGAALEALARGGELPALSFVIGGGSNLLVADEGISGTVLALRADTPASAADIRADADGLVQLDGAWDWPTVALVATRAGWQGLESMVGIPGTVGGAVVQSIGAYGYELRDLVVRATAVDLATGESVTLLPPDIGFRYRNTDLKVQDPPQLVVTGVSLRLTRGGRHAARYEELARKLGAGDTHDPYDVARAVLELRTSKSMVYDPQDAQTWGAGSFFKNPECSPDDFEAAVERLGLAAADVPHWFIERDVVRVSAGWLVERAGYRRGRTAGDVALCDNHALGIVNATGRATATDVAAFAGEVRAAVHAASGLALEPEPVLVGLDLPSTA